MFINSIHQSSDFGKRFSSLCTVYMQSSVGKCNLLGQIQAVVASDIHLSRMQAIPCRERIHLISFLWQSAALLGLPLVQTRGLGTSHSASLARSIAQLPPVTMNYIAWTGLCLACTGVILVWERKRMASQAEEKERLAGDVRA